MTEPTAEQLAEACSRHIGEHDRAAAALGIEVLESAPGRARLALTVTPEMTNALDVCHGGVIFLLADTAFAHASNNRNRATVAAAASIQFLAPGRIGDRLTATAVERMRGRRTSLYDIEVHNQDDELIALFRGNGHQVRGQVLPEGDTHA